VSGYLYREPFLVFYDVALQTLPLRKYDVDETDLLESFFEVIEGVGISPNSIDENVKCEQRSLFGHRPCRVHDKVTNEQRSSGLKRLVDFAEGCNSFTSRVWQSSSSTQSDCKAIHSH